MVGLIWLVCFVCGYGICTDCGARQNWRQKAVLRSCILYSGEMVGEFGVDLNAVFWP